MRKFLVLFFIGIFLIGTDISIKEKTSLIDGLNRLERCNIELIDNEFQINLFLESLFDYYKVTINYIDKNNYELSTNYFSYVFNKEKNITIFYINGKQSD